MVPSHHDFMWSHAALAALMAELSFLAAMTAAPRFCTVGRKVSLNQAASVITYTKEER